MSFLFDINGDDEPLDAPEPATPPKKRAPRANVDPAEAAISVSELTVGIKSTLERSFASVWVSAEITGIARPRSGHLYFTLKDESAQIRGVMWRSVAESLPFELEEGQSVLCFGSVEVYATRGDYQLIVRKCQPEGIGALQLAFMQLQNKLAAEGLFDQDRKRRLPRLPRCVAIVTSPSGAAIHDFLEAAAARHAGVEIVLIPASVQGAGAAKTIVAGIRAAHRLIPRPDVLIVARGGGSMEDLWSFNEEPVLRALAASKIPTVSAVGHEVDVTLSDLVADVRALTPTDAASRVLPDRAAVLKMLRAIETSMRRSLWQRARHLRQRLDAIGSRVVMRRPHEMIRARERQMDELDARARTAIWRRWRAAESRLATLAAQQAALSPLAVLGRGYSVTQGASGRVIRDAADVAPGEVIRTRLASGELRSVVE